MIRPLPGRMVVLIPDAVPQGLVLVPDSVKAFIDGTDSPGHEPLMAYVVAATPKKTARVEMPSVGSTVWIRPVSGLTFDHNDLDCPEIGAIVPKGHKLRILLEWDHDVYGVAENGFPTSVAISMINLLNPEKVKA